MSWKIVERKIGRAGSVKQRLARQKEWDHKYGRENWMVGYIIDREFVMQEDAIDSIYYQSYVAHFKTHPDDLNELIQTAKILRNPHSEATTGVDLQVPAILRYLDEYQLKLEGKEVLDIGSWQGMASHKLSIRLSSLQIKVVGNPKMTLEKYWQEKKCLAIWQDE